METKAPVGDGPLDEVVSREMGQEMGMGGGQNKTFNWNMAIANQI